jgi:predicted phage terminase large subunit-like protein
MKTYEDYQEEVLEYQLLLEEYQDYVAQHLEFMDDADAGEIATMIEAVEKKLDVAECKTSFMPYARRMWKATFGTAMIEGEHLRIMANAFERIAAGTLKRLIISVPPRHCKSEFTSWLLPTWLMGHNPASKVMEISHTAELAEVFGRRVRDTIDTAEYHEIFDTMVSKTNASASRWGTTANGQYFAMGVDSKVAGKGGNYIIVDDPHSEQHVKGGVNKAAFEKDWDWFRTGPLHRLQPDGVIIVVMTRWADIDMCAKIKQLAKQTGEYWEEIVFPALNENETECLWPEFWKLNALLLKKESMSIAQWSSTYMQDPTSEMSATIKREWWRGWNCDAYRSAKNPDGMPKIEMLLQSLDTAITKNDWSNPTAVSTWGIFEWPDRKTGKIEANAILVDCETRKMNWPELKEFAKLHYKTHKPELVIVETKLAGEPLIAELRADGIPVIGETPTRTRGKMYRVAEVSDLFESGRVWYPTISGMIHRWTDEMVEQCAAFPNGEADDLVDTASQALIRLKDSGILKTRRHYDDDEEQTRGRSSHIFGKGTRH